MKLYECTPIQTYKVFDYVKDKWYKKGKYIPREEREFFKNYPKDTDCFFYVNSKEEAEEQYWKIFDKEKIENLYKSYFYNSYYHKDKDYKIIKDKLDKKLFLFVTEYKNDRTLSYLKEHMNSEDFIYYIANNFYLTRILNI